jgi:spermidine/putrescine transport system substrate-binding protein
LSKRSELMGLARDLRGGTLSRREFVQRAAALGLGLGSISALLGACDGEPRGTSAVGSGPRGGESQELGPIEKKLSIYNWSDYIAPDTVPGFEQEFGVEVTYDTYESNEEMVAKLQAGATGYDIVVPSSYVIPVMVATDLLAPLARSHLTRRGNISAVFEKLPSDPDGTYSVPWQWGTTGLAYRTDKLPSAPESWAVFHDPRYAGKTTMMDDVREVIGAMLRYRGHSLNSVERAQLVAARADAIAAKQHLKAYISAPVKAQLISGDVWIAQLWNGDTTQARKEQPRLAYSLPREGSMIWTDSLVIPQSAPHKRAAHEFLNYILRPQVAAAISAFTGYGTPNEPASKLLEDPVPYPSPEELARLEYPADLGAATELWDQIWTEIKSA